MGEGVVSILREGCRSLEAGESTGRALNEDGLLAFNLGVHVHFARLSPNLGVGELPKCTYVRIHKHY